MADLVYLNGRYVPASEAVVSVFDRGFTYGDGLFETIAVRAGRVLWWEEHWARFARGAAVLQICCPEGEALRTAAKELIKKAGRESGILRLQLTRGSGARGYSPKGASNPTVVMTLHERPAPSGRPMQWQVITSSVMLPPPSPLTRCKSINRLPQVLARAEADAAGVDEALLLDSRGYPLQGTSGNLFWVENGVLITPPLDSGVLPGITREKTIALCRTHQIPWREAVTNKAGLLNAEGVFFTLTTWGVVEASSIDGASVRSSPVAVKLGELYQVLEGKEAGDAAASDL